MAARRKTKRSSSTANNSHILDNMNMKKINKMSTGKKIALGATGLAITAGAVAATVAFTNKKLRDKMTRNLRLDKAREMLPQGKTTSFKRARKEDTGRYQPYAHSVSKKRRAKSSSRGRKSDRGQQQSQS